MNAVERIQAAIDKLEAWKAEPQPEYLVFYDYDWVQDGNYDDLVQYVFPAGVDYGRWEERQRTINPQLDLLRLAVEYGPLSEGRGSRFSRAALTLANAILGADE